MRRNTRRPQFASRPEGSSPNVTSAIGMEETVGRLRARRTSLFTKTVIWVTGMICLAFLLATFAQAWSNSHLMSQLQDAQQHYQSLYQHHIDLQHLADHYKDPFVVESEAREQLGYIRPGEHPVVISSSTDQLQQNTAHPANTPHAQNFWQEWWDVFFGS